MCQEAATDMPRAVAAWCRAGHALCFTRLPRELNSIQVAIFLSLGCYGTSRSTSVGRVFPRHMSLTITTWDRTSERG